MTLNGTQRATLSSIQRDLNSSKAKGKAVKSAIGKMNDSPKLPEKQPLKKK